MKKKYLLLFLIFIFSACGLTTTRPKEEMSLAVTAFQAAMDASAQTLAPNFYQKAEFYYLKAKSAYKRKYFNKARQYSRLCIKFAERAEYIASKKKAFDTELPEQ